MDMQYGKWEVTWEVVTEDDDGREKVLFWSNNADNAARWALEHMGLYCTVRMMLTEWEEKTCYKCAYYNKCGDPDRTEPCKRKAVWTVQLKKED